MLTPTAPADTGTLTAALAALPQDLLRTLQRAANRLDLDVDGLTADQIAERYSALGCQITPDFATRVQRESAAARSGHGQPVAGHVDDGNLAVASDENNGSGQHPASVGTPADTGTHDAVQPPAPPVPANAPAALPITIRFIEWRCGHHGQLPDDIPAASREQAQLILQAIGYAISQPGYARAAVFDDHSGTTVYLTDDYAEEIKPGWPSRTVLYHATPDQLAELRRPELARAWDDCYGGELREWDGAALLDDEMDWVTTQDVAAITQALTPVAWHEEGQRREVCQVPPVLKPAAELLAELHEVAEETAEYEAALAADRAAAQEGGAS